MNCEQTTRNDLYIYTEFTVRLCSVRIIDNKILGGSQCCRRSRIFVLALGSRLQEQQDDDRPAAFLKFGPSYTLQEKEKLILGHNLETI